MATSAISANVDRAISSIAEYLRREEDDDGILQIGKRKPKLVREEKVPGAMGRWAVNPDWTAPSPMIDRPRTGTGATSFYFSFICVSKQAILAVDGKPISGSFGGRSDAAFVHAKYIERDGAAELSHGLETPFSEQLVIAETIDQLGFSANAEESPENGICELARREGRGVPAALGMTGGAIPSVFSNISDDPFERQEFWRAVERYETTPRVHDFILDPDISPAWWRELETTDKLDPAFKSHAIAVAEAYHVHNAQSADCPAPPPFIPARFRVTTDQAGRIIQSAQRMAHYNDHAPPFALESVHAGRVQFRIVAELPHELKADDRALIVQNFCDHISTLEVRFNKNGSPYKTGMMYTAVIHAPNSHNDFRNYHLHVVAYDRPCRFLIDKGAWDFEVVEWRGRPGSGSVRPHKPHRQLKIAEVSQGTSKTGKQNSGGDFIPGLRATFAEINNAVLTARGIKRHLDPRKYSDMGIDRTPTQHLGTKAAALEAIGVPTTVGRLNAIAIWRDAEGAIRCQAIQARKAYNKTQDEFEGVASAITAVDPTHPHIEPFRFMILERGRLIRHVAEDRAAIMMLDHFEAKAKSRAMRTRQTCIRYLADIENGKADRVTRRMRNALQDRWKGAQAHIEAIDKSLALHRRALTDAARDVELREARIVKGDTSLNAVKAVFEKRVAELSEAASTITAASPQGREQTALGAAPSAVRAAMEVGPEERVEPDASASPTASTPSSTTHGDEIQTPVEADSARMDGLPIIEPTIAPRAEALVGHGALEQAAAEGLAPLRRMDFPATIADAHEVVVADLDEAEKVAAGQFSPAAQCRPTETTAGAKHAPDRSTDGGADPTIKAEPEKGAPAPKVLFASELAEPSADSLKKLDAPGTSDPNGQPFEKPCTAKPAYAELDVLLARIADERIPIEADEQGSGLIKFAVPSLRDDEQKLLSNPRFAQRADQRLRANHADQQEEIQRVVRWIQTEGKNPTALKLENRKATLGASVPPPVRARFKNWGRHKDVIAALRAENENRLARAKELVQAARPLAVVVTGLEARQAEAARLYPMPDKAYTPQVEEFIKLLLEAAPVEQLRKAADLIYASARAREDINKHNVHLATAYRLYLDEPGIGQGHGRGLEPGR